MKKLANTSNPIISELLNGFLIGATKDDVGKKLDIICEYFIMSKEENLPDGADGILTFWIRGFEVTEVERKNGYLGNFVTVYILTYDKLYCARAHKVFTSDNKRHPAKINNSKSQRHPNYGYPAVRFARSGKSFKSLEVVTELIKNLRFDYPEVSIMAHERKIYFILWDPAHDYSEDTEKSVSKVVMKAKYEKEGSWLLSLESNQHQRYEVEKPEMTRTILSECNDLYSKNIEEFTRLTLPKMINGI
jgi:hypothetical protein